MPFEMEISDPEYAVRYWKAAMDDYDVPGRIYYCEHGNCQTWEASDRSLWVDIRWDDEHESLRYEAHTHTGVPGTGKLCTAWSVRELLDELVKTDLI